MREGVDTGRRALFWAICTVGVVACGGDGGATPGSGCPGIALRAGTGFEAVPTPMVARWHLTGASGAASTSGQTDAAGAACATTAGLSAPYTLTVYNPGYTAVTLTGLRGAVEGVVRLEPLQTLDEPTPRAVTGTVTNVPPGGASMLLDGHDVETAMVGVGGASRGFRTNTFGATGAPLTLHAIVFDGAGDMAHFTRETFTDLSQPLAMRFGAPPRFLDATLRIRLTPGGLFSSSSARPSGGSVVQRRVSSEGRSTAIVGSLRGVASSEADTLLLRARSLAEGVLPDGITVGIEVASPPVRINVWAHRYEGDGEVRVPVTRALELRGSRLTDLAFATDGDGWQHAWLQLSRSSPTRTQARWQVFAVGVAGAQTLAVPTLPPDLTLGDLGLDGARVLATGLLVRMHQGQPWTLPPFVTTDPAFEVAAGGRVLSVVPDAR